MVTSAGPNDAALDDLTNTLRDSSEESAAGDGVNSSQRMSKQWVRLRQQQAEARKHILAKDNLIVSLQSQLQRQQEQAGTLSASRTLKLSSKCFLGPHLIIDVTAAAGKRYMSSDLHADSVHHHHRHHLTDDIQDCNCSTRAAVLNTNKQGRFRVCRWSEQGIRGARGVVAEPSAGSKGRSHQAGSRTRRAASRAARGHRCTAPLRRGALPVRTAHCHRALQPARSGALLH